MTVREMTVREMPALRSRAGYGAVRMLTHAATRFALLPAHALLAFIWLYQRTLSPALPVIFGPACGCRFSPTCSHYAADAVRTHGAFIGAFLALRRLVKCTPLHPGGFDPVPAHKRPVCDSVIAGRALRPTCRG